VRGGTAVVEEPALTFAGLLRQLRAEARLTQQELAEAAALPPRSVSDLERGINRTARKETAVLLAGALRLAEPARALFVAAARGLVWFDALRDGVKVAGYRPVADALAPADLRVAFFGDLSGRKGAKSAGEPLYTAVDLRAGPERDLLESSYEATGRRSRRTGAATAADPAPAGFSLRISYPRDLTTTLAQTR
jgi:transcriptional regulator with XRE-family HTH domain